MNRPLKILILEDVEADALLMVHELKNAGFLPDWIRVDTENSYLTALASGPDLILSDYNLPQFDAFLALQLMQKQKLDIPFIVISGAITEDVAVEFMKRGAYDYLLKDRMARLGQAVVRALEQRELREEKRRTEQVLRESEEKYRILIENSHDIIYTLTPDGTFTFVSPGWTALLGHEITQVIGKSFQQFVHPDDIAKCRTFLRAVIETGQRQTSVEYRVQHAGGTMHWHSSNAVPLRDKTGAVIGFQGSARDITERKNAEEALHNSVQLMEKVYFSLHDALFIIEADSTKIIDCNPATSDIFGYSREDMINRSTGFLHISNASLDDFRVRLQSAIAEKGFLFLPEFQMKRKDGTIFFTENSVVPLMDDEGKNIGWVSVVRDITERKQAEEDLRSSEERFRLLSEASFEAIAIHEEGVLINANDQYFKMFGYEPGEALGIDMMTMTVVPEAIEFVTKQIATDGLGPYESTGLRKDGTRFPIEVRARMMEYKGRIVRFAAIIDITERKQAEATLLKKSEDLARSNADLAQFAYVANHDLQEPLRMVTSYVQLLEKRYKGKLDPDADEFIGYVVEGTKRMKQLLDALLDCSRVDTGGHPLQTVECERVLKNALQNLRMVLDETKGTVTHDPLPVIMADETQMVQLFQNLIGNGLKFHGPQPPLIHISTKQEGTNWIFSFQDNGIGIDPQYFEKIFVIFQRLHGRDNLDSR